MKITLSFFLLMIIRVSFGQSPEGLISYVSEARLQLNLPPGRAEAKANIPESRKENEQLFFNANESLYKPVETGEEEEFAGGGLRVRIERPKREIYTDREKSLRLTQQELFGKNYLIEDSLVIPPWKFGPETKIILGYECRQAFYTDDSSDPKREITAWYTLQIRPFLGPDEFNSLPGTVLAVDINNGERTVVATHVEFRPLKKSELKAPRSGSKVSREEFRRIMEEQMEQMRQSGRNMMIRN